jgi:hypothetical protein
LSGRASGGQIPRSTAIEEKETETSEADKATYTCPGVHRPISLIKWSDAVLVIMAKGGA